MSVAIVTGSAGLIGSEAVRFFSALGMHVVGIDNDMRSFFLERKLPQNGILGVYNLRLKSTLTTM